MLAHPLSVGVLLCFYMSQWMETHAALFLAPASVVDQLHLRAGDDAVDVKWSAVSKLKAGDLYANHYSLIQQAVEHIKALRHRM